jgi:aspartate kinase
VAYISEKHLKEIFNAFAETHLKVNTMQVSALSFSACFDDDENKFEKLYKALHPTFKVKYNKHLQLITIRHYNKSILATLSKDKTILLEQLSRNTAQLVLQDKM